MKRRMVASFVLLGMAMLGYGLYMPAKALAAQVLLEHAWTQTLAHGRSVKPWPWADTHPVARLRAPRLDVDLIAVAGATGSSLAFGPGHVLQSGAPGSNDTVVFGGHRDTHFRFLQALVPGDELQLQAADGTQVHYLVEQAHITDTFESTLRIEPGSRQLALVTCYPFDAMRSGGSKRYVISARSVSL